MHDTVAQKNFDPVLPPLPDDFEEELDEESVKIVRLVKNKEPLVSCKMVRNLLVKGCVLLSVIVFLYQGATIRRDETTGAVIVARIMRGGAADRSGMSNFVVFLLAHNYIKRHFNSVLFSNISSLLSSPAVFFFFYTDMFIFLGLFHRQNLWISESCFTSF